MDWVYPFLPHWERNHSMAWILDSKEPNGRSNHLGHFPYGIHKTYQSGWQCYASDGFAPDGFATGIKDSWGSEHRMGLISWASRHQWNGGHHPHQVLSEDLELNPPWENSRSSVRQSQKQSKANKAAQHDNNYWQKMAILGKTREYIPLPHLFRSDSGQFQVK